MTLVTHAQRRAGAFTLVELLVAVGAVALMALGIAQVFSATGKTVSAGKRLSRLNASAALLERQLRADFDAMTRDGFLVIRNERANAGSNVQLFSGDPAPRQRRVDELVFFAAGTFTTTRPPVHPDRIAESSSARIYYGHGQRLSPTQQAYDAPVQLTDNNAGAGKLGDAGNAPGGGINANRYASDWILARQVTLLCPPNPSRLTVRDLRDPAGPPIVEQNLNDWGDPTDNPYQIAWQPAAPSVFRCINGDWDGPAIKDLRAAQRDADAPQPKSDAFPATQWLYSGGSGRTDGYDAGIRRGPLFASGVVDIAATSLARLRRVCTQQENAQNVDMSALGLGLQGDPIDLRVGASAQDRADALRLRTTRQQEWFVQALPANSDNGRRVRVEPQPPNALGRNPVDDQGVTITELGWTAIQKDPAIAEPTAKADQLMLAASAFLPRCSEFVVEWSFGELDVTTTNEAGLNRMVWHGLRREVDTDSDGNPDYAVDPYGVRDVVGNSPPTPAYQTQYYRRRDGSLGRVNLPDWLVHVPDSRGGLGKFSIDTNLDTQNVLYSCFGYSNTAYAPATNTQRDESQLLDWTDPRKKPASLRPKVRAYASKGSLDVDAFRPDQGDVLNEPDTLGAVWPRLIRVTATLVDPADPSVERPFQFVFRVPQARGQGL